MRRNLKFHDLSQVDRQLVEMALSASRSAYAPYSGFAVGAAVRCSSGELYVGANLENASYGLSTCAEVSAIAAANTSGSLNIDTIAVVGHQTRPSDDGSRVVVPCGRCRQVIAEVAQISNYDIRVLSCSGDLSRVVEARISELLPEAFGPESLGLVEAATVKKVAIGG
ncbi:MAG: cytidine deaminase [Alphaproteobacteria bacterium]|nr:cytidine deaminase [Alphaproteobacteria bacterium]